MAENFKTIKCPACQKEMTKIFVPTAGINVDICLDGCGGIYLDNRELQSFDEQHENIQEILDAIKGKEFIKVNEDYPRTCPVCGAKMVKNYTSVKKEVQIDECYSCGGKFLDNGELQKIRAEYETEEDRSIAMHNFVNKEFGPMFEAMKAEAAEREARKSVFQKAFERLIFG